MSDDYLLLVEDNPGDAMLTMTLLEDAAQFGLPPIRWVQTIQAATHMLASDAHCIAILLDLGLPDSEGLDGLNALTETADRAPIIILTGSESQPMGLDAMSSGAQDFLVKGHFDAEGLQRAISFAAQRKRAELALVEKALKDELTGLPRRALALDRLQSAMRQARRERTTGVLLFIDLDGFKAVNDAHGHAAGDEVLRVIAQRLQKAVRATDTAARLGGDEFVVLLPTVTQVTDATSVAAKLLAAIELAIPYKTGQLAVSASIGLAPFDATTVQPAEVVQRADQAMYQAKQQGKGRVVVASAH